jgi:cytoskeletal protein CcmA (bactofilin family)
MFRRGEGEDKHPSPIDPKEVRMKETPGTEVTVVGQGARLEGTLVSAGSLRIDGQVKGKINADGDVVLSSQSNVEADIDAQNVTVGGRFKGNITVKNKAELARGGRVDGNITSKVLAIAEGAIFSGESVMDNQGGPGGSAGSGRGQVSIQVDSGGGFPSGDGEGSRLQDPAHAH